MVERIFCVSILFFTYINALLAQDKDFKITRDTTHISDDANELSAPSVDNPQEDTVIFTEQSTLDPNKAVVLSAVIPGLGQIYNKQYWKVPIIWGIGIGLGYGVNRQHRLYNSLRNALIAERDDDADTSNPFSFRFNENSLDANVQRIRRDRDFLIIISAVAYILNLVDAHVSAHLNEFEVNDDLTIDIKPSNQMIGPMRVPGLTLTLNF